MKTLLHRVRLLLLVLLVLAGVISALGIAMAPLLSKQTARLEEYLTGQLGTAVTIGSMTARWHLLGPSLEMHDVRIGDPSRSTRVAEAVVDVHFTDLVTRRGYTPIRITLNGMKLQLIREPDKRIHVAGLPLWTAMSAKADRTSWPRLRLLDAEIIWEDRYHGRAPVTIAPVTIDLEDHPGRLKLAGTLDSAHGSVAFAADLSGDLATMDWSGRTSVEFDELDLARLTGDYLPKHYHLTGSILSGRLHTHWADAIPSASDGTVQLSKIEIAGDETLRFDRIKTDVVYARDANDWRLNLNNVAVVRNDRSWPESDIAISSTRGSDNVTRVRVAADFLRIEDLMAVFRVRTSTLGLLETAGDRRPQGDLRAAKLDLEIGDNGVTWRAATQLHGIQLARGQKLPGLSNLSGALRAHSEHVQLELNSTDVSIDFGDLFPAPLYFDEIRGQIDWLRSDDRGWTLLANDLHVGNADITTRSRLHLEEPADRPLSIDLQTDFDSADIRNFGAYLPVRIMRPTLVRWLNRSIEGGKIPSGVLALQGPLTDFPYDKTHSGHFEVLFGLDDAKLNYLDEWPPLENMAAELRFHNNSLAINLASASIYDSQVTNTVGRFATLKPVSPLSLNGSVAGPWADQIRLLTESPLRNRFRTVVSAIKPSGQSALNIAMSIPMDKRDKYRLDGKVHLLNAGLDLPAWNLPLRDINGTLRFDLNSIAGTGLKAKGLNSSLSVDVVQQAQATRISVAAVLSAPTLGSLLPKLPLQHLSGSSPFKIGVAIPHPSSAATKPIWLDVESDLRGVGIQAPHPLGKPQGERRRLQVNVPLSGSGQAIHVRYGDLVDAVVSQDYSRAEVRLGGQAAQLPSTRTFSLRGNLPALAIDHWLNWLAPSAGTNTLPDVTAQLRVGELTYGDGRLGDTAIAATHKQGSWRGDIDNANVKGGFSVPPRDSSQPVRIDLEHLKIDIESDSRQAPGPRDGKPLDPRGWPAIEFHSKQFQVNRASLGDLAFVIQPRPRGIRIARLSVDGDLAKLDTSGNWEYGAQGPASQFNGVLTTPDLGKLLEELGFEKQLANSEARVDLDLSWPGDPSLISNLQYTGTLDLNIEQGRFLDIDPGVTRVVGLLNFNALQRRLRLDFTDLFRKGLSYDQITGHFRLDDGQAYTNDLTLIGPSGKIEVAGRTGLTTRDMDQLVSVTPRLDATLPVAGAIAGGPLTALAVLVAQQVMSKQVDQINRFQYSITGPWSAPDIKKATKGESLSKLLRPSSGDPGGNLDATAPSDHGLPERVSEVKTATIEPDDSPATETESQSATQKNLFEKLLDKLGPEGSGTDYLDTGN